MKKKFDLREKDARSKIVEKSEKIAKIVLIITLIILIVYVTYAFLAGP